MDPTTYRSHRLHDQGRAYPETNCYSDIVIELLHARGYEPLAAFGCLVRMDFEGDQWTFFKPLPEDLVSLFGVGVHEMQPYRPLPVQIAEQLECDRTLLVELDSWYLPDTASTSYRAEHVKTTIAADAIDRGNETLRYFHGGGLFELRGEDYRGALRLGEELSADVLPPYTELVRFDAGACVDAASLRDTSLELLRRHLACRPRENPFEHFGVQLRDGLPLMLEAGLGAYHAYAFATVRMAGAAFEIAATYAEWLLGEAGEPAASAMREIVDGCKVLGFRLARRRLFDAEPTIAELGGAWSRAIRALEGTIP